jgi:hypothetical protein
MPAPDGPIRPSMRHYRLILRNGANEIEDTREFVATDDRVAFQLCEGWRERRTAELWCGGKKVMHWGH